MAQSLTNKNRLLEKYVQVVREDGLNTNKNVNIGINGSTPNLWVAGNLTVGGTTSITSDVITAASANAFTVGANGTTNPQFNVDTSASSVATGLNIAGAAAGSGLALSVLSSGTNEGLSIAAKGTGTVTLTGRVAMTVAGGTPNALNVGQNGATNPALNVDTSTASSATGVTIKSAAAGAGVSVAVISSGTNENLVIAAKGTGTVTVNPSVAVASGGSAAASILATSTAALGLYFGTGAPTVSAAQGSLYVNTSASTSSTRLYVNNSSGSGTTWTAFTSAA